MKKTLLTLSLLTFLFTFESEAKTSAGHPAASLPTASFAIITDDESYRHCRTELELYRDAVRKQGLDAFIVEKNWKNPDEIRDSLLHYYENRHLEGAVFVGDIPVPMIRKAQHLASAFKMDEKEFPMRDSSIPSDRFYDDFDMKFEFVGRDSVETSFFYYELAPDSPQYIECDIYSGRIKPSGKFTDKYEELSAYLKKTARIKEEQNLLDKVTSYTGDGSFSNSLIAWKDETITLSEQFPLSSESGDGTKFYAFAMYPVMKDILLDEIRRDDLDLILFHEHGMPERQYLTAIPDETGYGNYTSGGFELGKYYARSYYRTYLWRGMTPEKAAETLSERYGIDSTWFSGVSDPEIEKADSLLDMKTGIVLEDIQAAAPNVRVAIFDACYNGDFREADCIASRYVMAGGNTVAAIGNSVNVLQDKSSSDLMGMLAEGYSIGEWMQQVNIIESHILGDPTFRFTPPADAVRPDLKNRDTEYWLKYTGENYPCDIRGLALHKLYSLRYEGLPELLMKTYDTSGYYMLRLQCMHLLAHYDGDAYATLLKKAMDDPYEFIRRKAAYYSGKVGSEDLTEPLAKMYLKEYNALRTAFNIERGGSMYPDGKFLQTLKDEIRNADFIFDKDAFTAEAEDRLAGLCRMTEEAGKALEDRNAEMRGLYISSMRNNPYPHLAEKCIGVVTNGEEPEELRQEVAEVLGWFVYAHNRKMIADTLREYIDSGADIPENVRREIVKTVNRLDDYCLPATTLSFAENGSDEVFIPCGKGGRTAFAIIADSETYRHCADEIGEYRDVLEEEGLSTYILADDWSDPMELRREIMDIAGRKPALEGIVLVGDIPIAMIREGQHLTTAFKMDEERFPEFESSVASDRFYDDFDLEFEFIKRDSLRSDVFYYRLSETGAQELRPEIYSARMRVPGVMDGDKYEILKAYLKKVVAAHREQNTLDNMTYFAGHGYNSDCLTVWRQKPMVFRENFPYCFGRSSQNRFLNFREAEYMEDRLFNELQRSDTDFFMFSEHGDFDTQYINSEDNGIHSLEDALDRLKAWIIPTYEKYRGTADEEPFLKEVLDSVYHISREAVSDSAITAWNKAVETAGRKINITLDEIMKLSSNPRFIIFNACYNGSFHRNDGYVAGCHVFGPGKCVVAQGNTVNVLQDKWEDKLLGMISMGERVGMWQREIPYLESHLIGDPTFRFASHSKEEARAAARLHDDLIFHRGKAQVWKKYLKSGNPVLRAAGITLLAEIGEEGADEKALEMLGSDKAWTVRLHALKALESMKSPLLSEAVKAGLEDPYEMIVRTSCHIAADMCDSTLSEALEITLKTHPDMVRVSDIAAGNALSVIDGSEYAEFIGRVSDKSLPDGKRRSALRFFRNSNTVDAIPALTAVVADDTESEALRRDACEALGWYTLSVEREEIISALKEVSGNAGLPERVKKEIAKTIKRLE